MPRLRRRTKNRTAYNASHLAQLTEGPRALVAMVCGGGWPCHNGMHAAEIAERTASMRAAWAELGDDLLESFIAAHPGRRPWAWWMFTATEPRQLLAGPGSHWWGVLGHAGEWRETFGTPEMFISGHDFDRPSHYETEDEYLDRQNLLTRAERSALTPAELHKETP
ncbi:MAG: hypothetical protein K8S99_03540 [Planctomycetes bacterium]|nr:hypothetical protein [Planctomycetota bacterium]